MATQRRIKTIKRITKLVELIIRAWLKRKLTVYRSNKYASHLSDCLDRVIRFFPPSSVQHDAQLILLDRASNEAEVHFNLIWSDYPLITHQIRYARNMYAMRFPDTELTNNNTKAQLHYAHRESVRWTWCMHYFRRVSTMFVFVLCSQ